MSTFDQLRSVRAFMDEHFDEPLSLAELARSAHLSCYHFIRLFQRSFYETPHQYLTRKRLEQAKYLLANSTLSVTDICFAVGFESMGSFSSLFHKTVGWSPSIYRARVWEQRRMPYKFIPGCFCTMYQLLPQSMSHSLNPRTWLKSEQFSRSKNRTFVLYFYYHRPTDFRQPAVIANQFFYKVQKGIRG